MSHKSQNGFKQQMNVGAPLFYTAWIGSDKIAVADAPFC